MLPKMTRPINQDPHANIDAPDDGGTEHLLREINYILARNNRVSFLARILKCALSYEKAMASD